jgi:S1/P1 Nuclease
MNRRWPLALTTAALICLCFLTAPAVAWNPSGHMIIALVAYDKLDDATKAKAIELLRAHPRFQDHFQHFMPKDVVKGSQAEQDEWCFAQAATWPDLMREAKSVVTREDVTKYNRGIWHYIDMPIYLSEDERPQLERQIKVNLSRDLPTDPDDPLMNVIQAEKIASKTVGDASAKQEDRSVSMCWLLHLIGDSHQPLHSSALFTTHRFREGDRGGNLLAPDYAYKTFQGGYTLHAFWDDAISTDEPYSTCRVLAYDLEQNKELVAAGEKATAKLDIGDWIDESYEICKHSVYTPEVRQQIAAREGHSHLGPLTLPPSYRPDSEIIGERRAMEAGYRLAKVLQQQLQ